MDPFGTNDLRRLVDEQSGPCVSVYLPTHVVGEEGQQDPVRLKNLLQRAEERLTEDGMRAPEARNLLQTARGLATDPAFWGDRSHGLAIFIAPGLFRRFRLPLTFDELVVVGNRFHTNPLLPLLSGGDRFLILALSQNKVRLFAASRYAIESVDVAGLPTNMDDALSYSGADRGSQVHSAMRGDLGKQAAVFHGQGGHSDTKKDDLTQFFRLIDTALQPMLGNESTPLLLAGVDYLLPIYRQVSSYSHIAEHKLEGNCDYLSAHQIHQKAWPLMEPVFHRASDAAAAKYVRSADANKATGDIRQIVCAAHEGKIETLFVDVHAHHWGLYQPETNTVELHDVAERGDDDLLNEAAVQTLSHGGTVYSVERGQVPSGTAAAAVFRY